MDKYPQLPLELVSEIFAIAASDHRAAAATLCLVSRWVQELVEPTLYRVRVLKNATQDVPRDHLHSPKSLVFLRSLGILHSLTVMNSLANSPLPNVRNFATDSTVYIRGVVGDDVEEFHLLTRHSFGRILFPRLKRLHYGGMRIRDRFFTLTHPIEDIINHQELTHIAFSAPDDPSSYSLVPTAKQVLIQHQPLQVFYIRLLNSSLPGFLRDGADYESMEVRLGSIRDPRLVVERVNIDASPEALLDNWEQNALNGQSLWDWAQIQVDERKELIH
ncbi:hypothetical protein BU17DRAFT_101097 [Hysterangium stoloniferum]|nr:hypothetical protein BU17DRAFT_101097 [Hysterangium stoloniferum]